MRTLLIIDPQNDFVDPRGSLYVKDSEKAVANIVKLLSERGNEIDCVCVSKDSPAAEKITLGTVDNI